MEAFLLSGAPCPNLSAIGRQPKSLGIETPRASSWKMHALLRTGHSDCRFFACRRFVARFDDDRSHFGSWQLSRRPNVCLHKSDRIVQTPRRSLDIVKLWHEPRAGLRRCTAVIGFPAERAPCYGANCLFLSPIAGDELKKSP